MKRDFVVISTYAIYGVVAIAMLGGIVIGLMIARLA